MRSLSCLLLLLFSFSAYGQRFEPREQHARDVAASWVQEMIEGNNPDSLMRLSAIPFQWEGRKLIQAETELRKTIIETIYQKRKGRHCRVTFLEMLQDDSPFTRKGNTMSFRVMVSLDGGKEAGIAVQVCFKDDEAFVWGVLGLP